MRMKKKKNKRKRVGRRISMLRVMKMRTTSEGRNRLAARNFDTRPTFDEGYPLVWTSEFSPGLLLLYP